MYIYGSGEKKPFSTALQEAFTQDDEKISLHTVRIMQSLHKELEKKPDPISDEEKQRIYQVLQKYSFDGQEQKWTFLQRLASRLFHLFSGGKTSLQLGTELKKQIIADLFRKMLPAWKQGLTNEEKINSIAQEIDEFAKNHLEILGEYIANKEEEENKIQEFGEILSKIQQHRCKIAVLKELNNCKEDAEALLVLYLIPIYVKTAKNFTEIKEIMENSSTLSFKDFIGEIKDPVIYLFENKQCYLKDRDWEEVFSVLYLDEPVTLESIDYLLNLMEKVQNDKDFKLKIAAQESLFPVIETLIKNGEVVSNLTVHAKKVRYREYFKVFEKQKGDLKQIP